MQQVVHTYVVYQQQYEISSYLLTFKTTVKIRRDSLHKWHSLTLLIYNCGCKYLMTKKFKKTKFIGPLVHTYICICYWIFKWFLMCIIIFWMTICKNNRKWVFLKTNLHLTSNRLSSAISSNCIKPRLVHNHFILSM